jgi:hypothetical protein
MKIRTDRTPTITATRAAKALQSVLRDRFSVTLNAQGYASLLDDVLLPGVDREDFARDLDEGAGKELEGKFLAAHSSSQLAVNAFAPFRRRLGDLRVNGRGQWSSLRFEAKCDLWPAYGGTPAHLDVLLTDAHGVLAIESKCTEYLSHKPAKFARSYRERITDDRRASVWFRELERLSADPNAYRHLDAAQLVKHALGLGGRDGVAALPSIIRGVANLKSQFVISSLAPLWARARRCVVRFITSLGYELRDSLW